MITYIELRLSYQLSCKMKEKFDMLHKKNREFPDKTPCPNITCLFLSFF